MLVRNKTLSPYDLESIDGPVRLPALGGVEGEFSGEYLELLEASMAVEVVRDHKPKAKKAAPAKAAAPPVAVPPVAAPAATPQPAPAAVKAAPAPAAAAPKPAAPAKPAAPEAK